MCGGDPGRQYLDRIEEATVRRRVPHRWPADAHLRPYSRPDIRGDCSCLLLRRCRPLRRRISRTSAVLSVRAVEARARAQAENGTAAYGRMPLQPPYAPVHQPQGPAPSPYTQGQPYQPQQWQYPQQGQYPAQAQQPTLRTRPRQEIPDSAKRHQYRGAPTITAAGLFGSLPLFDCAPTVRLVERVSPVGCPSQVTDRRQGWPRRWWPR